MATIQMGAWNKIVQNVAEESGGEVVDGVETEVESLDQNEADHVQQWLREVVAERKREEAPVSRGAN